MGSAPIIGATINHADHARALVDSPPDYVGIGPFRATSNKKAATYSLGLQGMRSLLNETQTILGRYPRHRNRWHSTRRCRTFASGRFSWCCGDWRNREGGMSDDSNPRVSKYNLQGT